MDADDEDVCWWKFDADYVGERDVDSDGDVCPSKVKISTVLRE